MPIIINADKKHPFLPSPNDMTAIDLYRAAHQDIRPLQFLMITLMADKIGTERQITRWLGDTEIQVQITFAATNRYIDDIRSGRISGNTPTEHILKFYNRFDDVKGRKFDGLIITGINAKESDLTHEAMWPEVREILDWSVTNVTSSLFLCWGAHAALKHFHGIDRVKQITKTWGVFDHHVVNDRCGLLGGFADYFPIPVSRWNEIPEDKLVQNPDLEITAISGEAGVGIITEPRSYDGGQHYYPHHFYVLNHPEYDTETLAGEYARDAHNPNAPKPKHYFPNDDVRATPINIWRSTGRLYANWVRAVYYATPYDLAQIPSPYQRSSIEIRLNDMLASTVSDGERVIERHRHKHRKNG